MSKERAQILAAAMVFGGAWLGALLYEVTPDGSAYQFAAGLTGFALVIGGVSLGIGSAVDSWAGEDNGGGR